MAKIPFGWLPGSWGLSGKTRKIAEAEYYYTGYDLDVELAKINHANPDDLKHALLDIDKKYKKIDEYEYDQALAKLDNTDDTKQQIALLDVELKHEKITAVEHEKQRANLLKEPWVSMPKISWDPVNKNKTYFELDYNDHFIKYLRDNNYSGTDDDVLNKWLNDVCISVIEDINEGDASIATPSRRSDNQEQQ